ncbi:MAG: twin-arginine translocation signal domain-containing protein, partial [Rhodospirillales bacterium]|nr:twin-arginine translocation signal domain-containing protein [Rhodospirillales bacterium]
MKQSKDQQASQRRDFLKFGAVAAGAAVALSTTA